MRLINGLMTKSVLDLGSSTCRLADGFDAEAMLLLPALLATKITKDRDEGLKPSVISGRPEFSRIN